MHIKFVRNIQFTKLIKANGRLREFNFRKIGSSDKERFTVDVSDDRGNRIIFHMENENGGWKIIEDQLPVWVVESENKLNEMIEEEMSGIR